MKLKPIKDFAEVITGGTPDTTKKEYWEDGNIPWLPSGDLKNCRIVKASKFITELGLKNSSAKFMPRKTVLIALTGATTGQTGMLEFEATANQSVTGILPSSEHVPEYLFYFLQTQRNRILSLAYGAGQPHISQGFVKDIKVPLPSLKDQMKTADILSKAESALANRRQTIRLADEFLKSAFIEMFGDPNKKGFERKKSALGDVDVAIIDGDRGSNYPKQNEFTDKGYCLFLNTKNVTKDGFSFETKMFISREIDARLRKGRLERNDLVLTTRGTVGNMAVYDSSIPFSSVRINSGMVILRPNLKTFTLAFLEHLFRSEDIKNQILTISSGCAQPQLPISSLKQLKVFVPSLGEQQKFADLVQKVEKLKAKQKQSEVELQNLFNSLMQRAFRGKLVN